MNTENATPLINKGKRVMGLPVLQHPIQHQNTKGNSSKYQQAYDDCGQAKNMIKIRLDKLQYEKDLLTGMKANPKPYNRDLNSIYNLRTLSNAKGQLANPNLYNHQFMDPIYYPIEMPINAEPITLPKIEMGNPLSNKCKGGFGIEELIALLTAMKKQPQPVMPQIVYPPPQPIPQPIPIPVVPPQKEVDEYEKVSIIPETSKKDDDLNRGVKRDWWRLARDFVNLYLFWSTANKYSKFGKVRNNLILQKKKAFIHDLSVLKDWVVNIEEPFWNEFKVIPDLNVSFKNIDSKLKIQKESQKIIVMIKKYMENLFSNITNIPDRIKGILYEYIKERAYYPNKYLTTYIINRIDFNFYGGTKNLSDEQMGMILAFLIVSGVSVQQILLHMKETFVEFRNYPNIDITGKYIGSIMHYLTRDTFQNNPVMMKELLTLMNYYRNYHIYNDQIENQKDTFNNNMVFLDKDEFSEYLVPENQISQFWNINPEFVDQFKHYMFKWACNIAKSIKLKYQKNDVNLLPKRILERPPDKTAEYEIRKKEKGKKNN